MKLNEEEINQLEKVEIFFEQFQLSLNQLLAREVELLRHTEGVEGLAEAALVKSMVINIFKPNLASLVGCMGLVKSLEHLIADQIKELRTNV